MKKKPPSINTIIPAKGMCLNVYTYRADTGAGTRNVIVVGLSPRYVTLFYAPKLHQFKVKRKEWASLPAIEYKCATQWLIDNITNAAAQHATYGWRYSKVTVARALEVLRKRQMMEVPNAA